MCGSLLITHITDITRAEQSPALRENWATPFYFTFILCTCFIFRPYQTKFKLSFFYFVAFITCTLFCLLWQFNQFVILLTSIAIFGTSLLGFTPKLKSITILWVQWFSLLVCSYAQFGNKFILCSFPMSLIPIANVVLIMFPDIESRLKRFWSKMVVAVMAFVITLGTTLASR